SLLWRSSHTIVRVANEGAEVACLLCPECVKGMTVDVRHQRRDRPALRHARGLGEGSTLRQHPGTYPQTQQPDHPTIADPAADESQKQVLVETPVEEHDTLPTSRTFRRPYAFAASTIPCWGSPWPSTAGCVVMAGWISSWSCRTARSPWCRRVGQISTRK